MKDDNCIFCKIVSGETPASIVHRDEHVLAFMDVAPVVEGHVLVIPAYHTADLAGVSDDAGARMFALGRRVAAALRASGLPCEGINLFLADGVAAGQTVFHSHLHVIPRIRGDGLGFRHGLGRGRMPRVELDELASRLASRV
jgi:diadenosine tetraphosphate (Ap4A) HIT family hydrolase